MRHPGFSNLRSRVARRLGATAEAQPRFAAANHADIKNRMSAPSRLFPGRTFPSGQSELDAPGLRAYDVQAGIKAMPGNPAECFSPLWAKFNNGRPIYSYGGFA